jgi:predicted ribosome quality control (RQC) complex YloA/Tae2 family protein
MKEFLIDDVVYRVGRNAKDNTQLIKDSDPEWLWFHLDKFPSCHVVACFAGLNGFVISKAASLVKEHSKYKFKNIGVNYCKISNLLHGVESGSVHFVSNKQVLRIHV